VSLGDRGAKRRDEKDCSTRPWSQGGAVSDFKRKIDEREEEEPADEGQAKRNGDQPYESRLILAAFFGQMLHLRHCRSDYFQNKIQVLSLLWILASHTFCLSMLCLPTVGRVVRHRYRSSPQCILAPPGACWLFPRAVRRNLRSVRASCFLLVACWDLLQLD